MTVPLTERARQEATYDASRVEATNQARVDMTRAVLEAIERHTGTAQAEQAIRLAKHAISELWCAFEVDVPHGITPVIRSAREDLDDCPHLAEPVCRALYDIRDKLYRFGSE